MIGSQATQLESEQGKTWGKGLPFVRNSFVKQPTVFEKLSKNASDTSKFSLKDGQFLQEHVFGQENLEHSSKGQENDLQLCESLTNNTCEEVCEPLDFKKKKNQVCMHISPENQFCGRNIWQVDPNFVIGQGPLRKKLKRKATLNNIVNDSSSEFSSGSLNFKSYRLALVQKPSFFSEARIEVTSDSLLDQLFQFSRSEPPKISSIDFEDAEDQYWGDEEND